MGDEWKHKCERGLKLAKQLGNIYTGSLYNGLVSLVCDSTIDLSHRSIMMFSYGSGCAASLFVLRFSPSYSVVAETAKFQDRLDKRIRLTPEHYD